MIGRWLCYDTFNAVDAVRWLAVGRTWYVDGPLIKGRDSIYECLPGDMYLW